ncbi:MULTISPECIES: heme o synthase [Gordonia]|uniref:Protoheme IX farnesyltransferase n=1 Tax=Gordonia amicalis TaxID=89053 RepID=A0ABU4DA26_9ACTN|nr:MULTISPECIES: heme o synthase [Gordonia]ATD70825.1 protoheme IX farnesyltransferase [Gordonia sp. 1D]MCZ0913248.1 heme o synthase [Gordonia amicalis]MCZ4577871.1 heme o synthase [Gordonia amicalis]MCZ4652491.1 heme o synthase [Gordonia amicalis]MDJ0451134.1 heme o synthase [Gordonia amicalis]
MSGDHPAASHSTDTASPQVSTEPVLPADLTWAGRVRATVLAYVALTKPRVIELLLVATIPVMLQADRGHVDIAVIAFTLIGGWLGAGSANTLNMVVDADIDKKMKRTERRPLARRAVATRSALIFGLVLWAASFAVLYFAANLLSSLLVSATIIFYVGVYTMILKRRTWQNVVWGGAAGCMPTLVGWAAVTGSLSWQPIVLFLVIFFWTPPHTWALAMRYKEDYKAAGVPMLPVIATEERVTRQMLVYTWLTVVTSLALIPATSWIYTVIALVAGGWFLERVTKLYRDTRRGAEVKPLKVFLQSNEYLAIVFCGLAVDAVVGLQTISSYF